MYLIGQSYEKGGAPWGLNALAERLFIPQAFIGDILALLQRQGLLIMTVSEPPTFVPARSIEHITLLDIAMAVRSDGDEYHVERECDQVINDVMLKLKQGLAHGLASETLKDLVHTESTK